MTEATTPAATVPSTYLGLWKRSSIRRQKGAADTTTQVWWAQSPSFHVDLRIPPDRPVVASAADLAWLDDGPFAHFAAQTGFAGLTVVDGVRCDWRPEIAFPAVSKEIDAGTMRFDSADALHETGIDGSYEEDWARVAAGPVVGLRLCRADGALAYLISGDGWLVWGQGRPGDAFPDTKEWGEFLIARRPAGTDASWPIIACNNGWRERETIPGAAIVAMALSCNVGDDIIPHLSGPDAWQVTAVSR